MEKKKKINYKILIIVEIIFAIILFFVYRYIFEVETTRNTYAEASEKFAEDNEEPVFKVGQVILYNSAIAVDNSDGELKDIDISQYTDIEIYIDNTQKSEEITAENTINEMYIDNIKITTGLDSGTKIFNYKNPYYFGKYVEIDNYQDDGLLFQIANTNSENDTLNYDDNVFFTDCSNPISLGYINKNILTGCEVNSSDNGSIAFDGTILESAKVDLEELKPTISFTIHIVNNYNEEFVCDLTIEDDLTGDDGGIYTGYVIRVLNTNDIKYNFFKVSD